MWEPADEGDLAADWMAVKGAGWVEPPSDYDDGEALVGRRVFVLDEGFGRVKRHKARKRGGGMTTIDFDEDGSKTVCLRLAGNKSNTTAWLAKPSAFSASSSSAARGGGPAAVAAASSASVTTTAETISATELPEPAFESSSLRFECRILRFRNIEPGFELCHLRAQVCLQATGCVLASQPCRRQLVAHQYPIWLDDHLVVHAFSSEEKTRGRRG